jgi:LuxR family maltose regulon positive regulatory protein
MDAAQGRFAEARTWLDRATPLVRDELDPAGAMFVHFVHGDLYAGAGQFADAVGSLRRAERLQRVLSTRHLLIGPIRAAITVMQLRAGDVPAARATLGALGDGERDGAEARLAIAALRLVDNAPAEVIATLAPVITGAVPVLRLGILVQALVVAATARDRLGDAAVAAALIEHALDLAEPDGLVLPFVTAPAPGLVDLLERHPRHQTAHAALLSDLINVLRGSAPAVRASRAQALAEELSSSELRVLRYLPSNLTASEIAAELFVSTSTVKTHMRHIYDKLDTHRRTEAVERARALGLLAPSMPRRP